MRSSLIFFEYLNDDDIAWICQVSRKQAISIDQVVMASGKPNQTIYILLEGKCRVETVEGRPLDVLSRGDILGEVSFVDRRKTAAQVRAETDVVLAQLDEDVLGKKLVGDPMFAVRFYRGVASVLAFRLRLNLQTAISKDSDLLSRAHEFVGEIDVVDLDETAKAGARFSYLLSRLLEPGAQ